MKQIERERETGREKANKTVALAKSLGMNFVAVSGILQLSEP